MRRVLLAFLPALLLASCRPVRLPIPDVQDLSGYRAKHPTHLSRRGPPPESWQDPTPLDLPTGVEEVVFPSGPLKLRAWLSQVPPDGQRHPAVVYCHGGFWFGNEDWTVLRPFLEAGFVVMAPRVRAENGNPGDFGYYDGEVDDVIAAGRFLAARSGVDPARVFVSGHSAGGDLAALAAEMDNPFAVSAPIGAVLDLRPLVHATDARHQDLVVFDPSNAHEVEARSALLFTASLRIPVCLFHGSRDWGESLQVRFVGAARSHQREASLTTVEGNHQESQVKAIPEIIKIFRQYVPKPKVSSPAIPPSQP